MSTRKRWSAGRRWTRYYLRRLWKIEWFESADGARICKCYSRRDMIGAPWRLTRMVSYQSRSTFSV